MHRLCLTVVLLWLLAPTPTRAAATLEGILSQLRREPPVSEPFHDIRYRRALKAPLVTAGTLTWRGGFDFERRVETPYRETGRVQDRTLAVRRERGSERIIPLARAPELQVLFAGLSAMFAGDAAAVQRDFTVGVTGDASWRLRLVPRDESLRARVPALELRGTDDGARCLILSQGDAETLTIFGVDGKPAPGADFAATVAAQCPSP